MISKEDFLEIHEMYWDDIKKEVWCGLEINS